MYVRYNGITILIFIITAIGGLCFIFIIYMNQPVDIELLSTTTKTIIITKDDGTNNDSNTTSMNENGQYEIIEREDDEQLKEILPLPEYTTINLFLPFLQTTTRMNQSSSSGDDGSADNTNVTTITAITTSTTTTTFRMEHFHYLLLVPNRTTSTTFRTFFTRIRSWIGTKSHKDDNNQQSQQPQPRQQQQYNWNIPINVDDSNYHINASSVLSVIRSSMLLLYKEQVDKEKVEIDNNNNDMISSTTIIDTDRRYNNNNNNNNNNNSNSNICHLICRFSTRSFGYTHFPHFYQQLLPCLSILDYLTAVITTSTRQLNSSSSNDPTTTLMNHNNPTGSSSEYNKQSHLQHQIFHYTIVLPKPIKPFSSYIQSLIDVLQQNHTYHIQFVYGLDTNNYSIPVPESCSTSSSSPMSIMAIKAFDDSGWDYPSRYFISSISSESDVESEKSWSLTTTRANVYNLYNAIIEIQKSVLQSDYRSGPSTFDIDINTAMNNVQSSNENNSKKKNGIQYRVIQVLVLDRKQSSRDFVSVYDMLTELRQYVYYCTISNVSYRMNVTYIASFNWYTLYEQARAFHTSDIIFSPHGAQLSNSIYIRPCTVVIEFFPKDYYLQFFQSLVVNANGISYESYPTSYRNVTCNKIIDTQMAHQNKTIPTARKARIHITSQFFRNTNNNNLQQIIDASIQCRNRSTSED